MWGFSKKIKLATTFGPTSCGTTALINLSRLFNLKISEKEILEKCDKYTYGTTMYDLCNTVKELFPKAVPKIHGIKGPLVVVHAESNASHCYLVLNQSGKWFTHNYQPGEGLKEIQPKNGELRLSEGKILTLLIDINETPPNSFEVLK